MELGSLFKCMAIAVKTGVFTEAELACLREELVSYYDDGLGSDRIIVSENGDGFAIFGPLPMTTGSWMLYWIAVEPSSQGSGIASRLLNKVEAHVQSLAKGVNQRIFIETSSTDKFARARRFYEKFGYLDVAEISDYYSEGDSKCVYMLTL